MRIGIIGGGINGYCCGVRILEHFKRQQRPVEVTIISEYFSPNTTGDGSAGLWGPYLLGGTSTARVHKWSKGMHDFLQEIWLSEDAGEAGVCLLPVIRVTTASTPMDDFWRDIVYGFAPLSAEQLQELNEGRKLKFTAGVNFVTYTSEPVKLLPYLMKRFSALGGKVRQAKVHNLEEFLGQSEYEAVLNCSGLGAREMLADKAMYAVRGQVSRVKANWLYYCLLDESDVGNYIIPNMESVVLGGTHQEHDYNTQVDAADKAFIVQGCREIVPGLAHAQHLFDWVGLRPGRTELRLEAVPTRDNKVLIHNYGHGGSGVTLAWGCAEDVLELLDTELNKRAQRLKSKL